MLWSLAHNTDATHTTTITAQDDATIFTNAFYGWANFHNESADGDTGAE